MRDALDTVDTEFYLAETKFVLIQFVNKKR